MSNIATILVIRNTRSHTQTTLTQFVLLLCFI